MTINPLDLLDTGFGVEVLKRTKSLLEYKRVLYGIRWYHQCTLGIFIIYSV